MAVVIGRFEVYLVRLDPTLGHEIKKTRPCVIVSPNEINHHLGTVIVAPMTTKIKKYPTRIPLSFQKKKGEIALDQIRTIDKERLLTYLGMLDKETRKHVADTLVEMFET